jgi:hypothetical protein
LFTQAFIVADHQSFRLIMDVGAAKTKLNNLPDPLWLGNLLAMDLSA